MGARPVRYVARPLSVAAALVSAGCAGSSIEAFPVPTHRPQEVQMEGARLNEAVSEFISFEGTRRRQRPRDGRHQDRRMA